MTTGFGIAKLTIFHQSYKALIWGRDIVPGSCTNSQDETYNYYLMIL